MTTKTGLIEDIPFSYLKEFVADTGVIRFGGPNCSRDEFVEGIARRLSKGECEFLNESFIDGVPAAQSAKTFNEGYRPDEGVVREKFLEHLAPDIGDDEAMFFEHPVGPNRSDINRFNGQSYTYELKSPRDTYKRIDDQLHAYKKVFEYIYLVLPEEFPAPSGIDNSVGVIRYDHPSFDFWEERESARQTSLDPAFQLHQLRLDELKELAGVSDLRGADRETVRSELVEEIISRDPEPVVNRKFKETLKARHID